MTGSTQRASKRTNLPGRKGGAGNPNPKTDHLHKWKPGQSGNPSGRPKALSTIRDMARSHTESAIATLVEVMKDVGAPPSARVAAASNILDRGWGRPVQEVQARIQTVRALTDDELVAFLAGIDGADQEPAYGEC